jgi:hypothetical protein
MDEREGPERTVKVTFSCYRWPNPYSGHSSTLSRTATMVRSIIYEWNPNERALLQLRTLLGRPGAKHGFLPQARTAGWRTGRGDEGHSLQAHRCFQFVRVFRIS